MANNTGETQRKNPFNLRALLELLKKRKKKLKGSVLKSIKK